MANTALKSEDITEYYDDEEKIKRDVKNLAEIIKSSTHCVFYTGAGISTSAGISDFRGPNGVWTLKAKGIEPQNTYHHLMPTKGHMAIKALVDYGFVKYVVSQNVDGLHTMSGLTQHNIAELHGNTFKEYCKNCRRVYYRKYDTSRNNRNIHDHRTGRKCDSCGSELHDTIINFGESLPRDELANAIKESKLCDLAIVLGTSLRVSPACDLPLMNKGNLVICNLQKTPFDNKAAIVLHMKCDQLMELLMDELRIPIMDFWYDFELTIEYNKKLGLIEITHKSIDLNNILNSLIVSHSKSKNKDLIDYPGYSVKLNDYVEGESIKLTFDFNIMNRFVYDIDLVPPCTLKIEINTTQGTLQYIQSKK